MKRSVKKHILEGGKLIEGTRQNLTLSEVYELCESEKADAVIDAFYMGVAVGARKAAKQ